MDKGSNGRDGKIVSSGHSTRVEGLEKFLRTLERLPEVGSIRLGPITRMKTVGRRTKKPKVRIDTNDSGPNGLRIVQYQTTCNKRARGGGGFSFRAIRPTMIGTLETGIYCQARYGTLIQTVVLTGNDLEALKSRLQAEGYGANW